MSIRIANESEWEIIQRLNFQIFEHELQIESSSNMEFSFSEEAIQYFKMACSQKNGHITFAYEHEGQIVGYAIAKIISDEETTHRVDIKLAQLHTFCVDKKYRGNGFGSMLIDAVKTWSVEQGATNLKIVAYAGNTPTRRLYEKAGFREFEIVYEMDL